MQARLHGLLEAEPLDRNQTRVWISLIVVGARDLIDSVGTLARGAALKRQQQRLSAPGT
jgi:hypothetical protein